MSVLHGI